jgi:hypothetical protein
MCRLNAESSSKGLNRSNPVGFKLNEIELKLLSAMARSEGKPLGEWCRATLLTVTKAANRSMSETVLLAEIAATQAILIDLIYTWAQDGKLTQKGVQEIVSTAQRTKFKEAEQLFQAALARLDQRLPAASSKGSS